MVGIVLIQQNYDVNNINPRNGCLELNKKLARKKPVHTDFRENERSAEENRKQTKERLSSGEPKFENSRVYA
jgi:hypothetical protein